MDDRKHAVTAKALALALLLAAGVAEAATVTVAVAANFKAPAEELAEGFEAATGHTVRLSFGSTGKHYAQIRQGAPFGVFLAADAERPARLEAEGVAIAGSRFSYALGRLALWSSRPGRVRGPDSLRQPFDHLAIANPRTAPYGAAAEQVLRRLGLWEAVQPRLVRGENIGQAYQYVATGNAELGFVALSQLAAEPEAGSAWRVPAELHAAIEQQAVLLRDVEPARAFLAYLRSAPARELIGRYGYGLPER